MLLSADRVLLDGEAQAHVGVEVGRDGRIQKVRRLEPDERPDRMLARRLLMPGMTDAHTRVWPRLVARIADARADRATVGGAEALVLRSLDPEGLLRVARLVFIEMLRDGVTTVAVMDDLHHQPSGAGYLDPIAMADALLQAARETGIRVSMVRTMRIRGREPADLVCLRCGDPTVEAAADDLLRLAQRLSAYGDHRLSWALGAQSLTAMPMHALIALKTRFAHAQFHLPVHGTPAERHDVGVTPRIGVVEIFATANLVDSCTLLGGDVELGERERDWVALLGAFICHRPGADTDRAGKRRFWGTLPFCLGSGHRTSVREVARELAELSGLHGPTVAVAADRNNAVAMANVLTAGGGRALRIDTGRIAAGCWADLASFDLQHDALAGATDADLVVRLLSAGSDLKPCEVMVGGRWVVEEGQHAAAKDAEAGVSDLVKRYISN